MKISIEGNLPHKNILITGGSLQASSRGIEGLVLGTITSIKNANPDVSFIAIAGRCNKNHLSDVEIDIGGGEYIKEYLIRARHYPRLLLRVLLSSIFPNNFRNYFCKSDLIITAYLQADVIVSLSAGDSFSDIYGYRQFIPHYLFDLIAIILKRPLIIFPQTIGPFNHFWGRLLARFSLRRAKIIFTRESYSTETVKKLCGNKANVIEKVDIAFLMKPAENNHPKIAGVRPRIGLNVSGFLSFSPAARILIKDFDYIQFIKRVIKILIDKYDADIFLLPHDYELDKNDDDLRACEILYDSLEKFYCKKVIVIKEQYKAPELKTIIGKYDFFIGARLHACIAALSMKVPTVPIAYSYKFIGILNKVGLDDEVVCDPRKDSVDCMLGKIQGAFENRELLYQHLKKKIPEIQEIALTCGKLLNDFIVTN